MRNNKWNTTEANALLWLLHYRGRIWVVYRIRYWATTPLIGDPDILLLYKSRTSESFVPSHRHKRISDPWPLNNTTNRLHTVPNVHPTKVYTTIKGTCSPEGHDHKDTEKKTGRIGQDLRHPNILLVDGALHINRNTTYPLPTSKYWRTIVRLPGDVYHIKLRKNYKPVQHPPRSVPVKLNWNHKEESQQLWSIGIITSL